MRLTFAYDGVLFYDNKGNWYGRNYAVLSSRYNVLSDDITYLMRTKLDDNAVGKMTRMPTDIKVVPVPNIMSPKDYIKNKIKANRIIEKQIMKSDCVIARLPGTLACVAIKYAKKHKVPCIVEVVGCVWDSLTHHSLLGKIIAPIEFIKTRYAIFNSEYVIYVTNSFLEKRYPTRGKYAAISDVELNPITEDMLARRMKSKNTSTLVLGTAGAVDVSFKGQQYVIRALSQLKRKRKSPISYCYRIAGGGDKRRLEELAVQLGVEDLVVFDGSIPQEKMTSWYDELDIYIQPSTVEGMPRALLEAMSRGVPAIGSRVGGIPELINEEALFKKGNVGAIVNKITSLDKEALKKLGRASYIKSQGFTKENLSKRRNAFYSLVKKERGL